MRRESSRIEAAEPIVDEPTRRKISGAEFDRLVGEGFFKPGERVELLNGELIARPPIGEDHASGGEGIEESIRAVLLPGHYIRIQNPFDVGEDRLYPDLVVLPGSWRDYIGRTPTPKDAVLV